MLASALPTAPDEAPAAGASPGRRRWSMAGAVAAALALGTWLQVARAPGTRPYQTFWAEDGGIFYAQALRDPLSELLFTPHAGYLQAVARLVSQPAAHLPLEWGAAYMAFAAALVTTALAMVVFVVTRTLIPATWARAVVAGVLVFLPQLGFEVIASVCNLHWSLIYAGFWVLVSAPTRRWTSVAGASALVALAALSDPLTALLVPAALVGVLLSRHRLRALVAPAVLVLCLALQLFVNRTRAVSGSFSDTNEADLGPIYAVRVLLSAVTGDRLLPSVYQTFGPPLAALVALGVVALFVVLMRRADNTGRIVAGTALLASVSLLLVALVLRGTEGFMDRSAFSVNHSRYTIVPLMTLWAALVVLVARRRPEPVQEAAATADGGTDTGGDTLGEPAAGGPSAAEPAAASTTPLLRWGWAPVAITGFLFVQLLSDWSHVNVRSDWAHWVPAVEAARAECENPSGTHPPQPTPLVAQHVGRFDEPLVPGPDDIVIPVGRISPEGELVFGVTIPCSDLRDAD